MARQTNNVCDICRKPTSKIMAKMYYGLVHQDGEVKKKEHANYTHHLDVGVCCYEKILKLFAWQKRKTKEEYMKSRRG